MYGSLLLCYVIITADSLQSFADLCSRSETFEQVLGTRHKNTDEDGKNINIQSCFSVASFETTRQFHVPIFAGSQSDSVRVIEATNPYGSSNPSQLIPGYF